MRYDGTLRVVMWLDVFWSVVAVLVSIVGSLAVALLGLPGSALGAVAATSLVAALRRSFSSMKIMLILMSGCSL